MTILDISAKRLSVLEEVFGSQIQTLMSNPFNIESSVRDADVVIGAVLIPGAKAPNSLLTIWLDKCVQVLLLWMWLLTKVGLLKLRTA